MDDRRISAAKTCLEGAESNAMTFPEIVGTLMQEGFESYMIDFRPAAATYYLPDGDSIDLPMDKIDVPTASAFNVTLT